MIYTIVVLFYTESPIIRSLMKNETMNYEKKGKSSHYINLTYVSLFLHYENISVLQFRIIC